MIGIGLAGYGRWGQNLARNFAAAGARIVAVSDPRPERLASAMAHYAPPDLTSRWSDLVANPRVDAIVIATPPSAHFEIASAGLAASKHVLVEKPLSLSSDQARRLIDVAAHRGLTLMVDHTFVYASAIESIRRMATGGILGDLIYYDGVRISAPPPHDEIGVLWDLAVHDVAIMCHIAGQLPIAVAATGFAHSSGSPLYDAQLTLRFADKFTGNVHVSWLSPVKIRRTLIGGTRRMIIYDDLEPTEKLRVYAHDLSVDRGDGPDVKPLTAYADSEMWATPLGRAETLQAVSREFLDCILTGRRPLTDGEAGLRVIEVLEIAGMSLLQGGPLLRLPDGAVF
jgi:predicted dehydrogenase